MAFVKISGKQIQDGAVKDQHVAADAAIAESKLSINFHAHTETLADKKVLYKVQVNDVSVSAGTSELIFAKDATSGKYKFNDGTSDFFVEGVPAVSGSDEGVVVGAPYNKVTLRDGITNSTPFNDVHGHVVHGFMTYDEANDQYVLTFDTTEEGIEAPYPMPADCVIDFFYLKRGNLLDMPEDYAVSEGGSFVEGAMDVTASFNLEQLAKDIYGGAWKLDADGAANLTKSLADQIGEEVVSRTNADTALGGRIDGEITARTSADNALQGALNTEVQDRKDADKALSDRIAEIETGGGAEVAATHTRVADTANHVFGAKTFVDLEERLDDIESVVDAEVKALQDADAAEKKAREDAIAQEVTDRTSAVNAEKDRAVAAEGKLTSDLATEAQRAKDAEKVLTDNLASEVTRATDAEAVLTQALADEVARAKQAESDEKTRAMDAEKVLTDALAAEVDRATDAEQVLTDDLAAEALRATTAEGVITDALTAEVSRAKGAEQVLTTDLATETQRAKDAEGVLAGRATALETEVIAARGSAVSVDARLDRALNEDGTLKAGKAIHAHKKFVYQAVGGETVVNLPLADKFQVGDDSCDVFVNGVLQAKGLHYAELADGSGIDFSPEILALGDVVVIKYFINNAE